MQDSLNRLKLAFEDRYRIERELGQGGMATVYLAHDLKHHRKVAIKVLHPELVAALGAERFLREIETTANLRHPHILPLYDSGEAGGFLFYVMPLVEGESLGDRLQRERQLPLDDALQIVREVADALSYAHNRGVIHRDIKPDNILLDGGHAVVADFGIARAVSAAGAETLTRTGTSIGTPTYMSPEQSAGERTLDGRSDLYSLACVLYEMLAGQPPFTGPTAQSLIHQHMVAPPPDITHARPSLPGGLASVLTRALAKNPADRFRSMTEFAAALLTGGVSTAPSLAPRRKLRWAPVAVVLLFLAVAGWWATTRGRTARPTNGMPNEAVPSIAVLAFTDLSADQAGEYLGDGIAETLINALSRIAGLRVTARSSAFSFKGRTVDVRSIGSQLGVRTVLEGSVQQVGTRLRVSARLINATDGFQLWTEKYDRTVNDVFAVQDEVARAIVTALAVKLGPDSAQRIVREGTTDHTAYDAYLLGRFQWNKRTIDGLQKAAAYFEQAVRADSGYAPAWAGLADSYMLSTPRDYAVPGMTAEEALRRAEVAARRAITLDPRMAEPHASLAFVSQGRGDWRGAEREYQRAIALNPQYASAHQWYASNLLLRGRSDEGLTEIQQAAALDPLSPIIGVELATQLSILGRMSEASALFARVTQLHPDFPNGHYTAWSHYLVVPDFELAARHFRRMLELTGVAPPVALRVGERMRDATTRPALLRAIADSGFLAEIGPGGPETVSYVSATNTRLNAYRVGYGNDRAIDYLVRVAAHPDNRDVLYLPNLLLSMGPELRRDPRAQAALRKLGMP